MLHLGMTGNGDSYCLPIGGEYSYFMYTRDIEQKQKLIELAAVESIDKGLRLTAKISESALREAYSDDVLIVRSSAVSVSDFNPFERIDGCVSTANHILWDSYLTSAFLQNFITILIERGVVSHSPTIAPLFASGVPDLLYTKMVSVEEEYPQAMLDLLDCQAFRDMWVYSCGGTSEVQVAALLDEVKQQFSGAPSLSCKQLVEAKHVIFVDDGGTAEQRLAFDYLFLLLTQLRTKYVSGQQVLLIGDLDTNGLYREHLWFMREIFRAVEHHECTPIVVVHTLKNHVLMYADMFLDMIFGVIAPQDIAWLTPMAHCNVLTTLDTDTLQHINVTWGFIGLVQMDGCRGRGE